MSCNILVVDDYAVNLIIMEMKLKRDFKTPHKFIRALSADEALELIKLVDIDLVLADFHMEGKTGVTLHEEAEEQGFKGLFFYITGDILFKADVPVFYKPIFFSTIVEIEKAYKVLKGIPL